MRLEPTRAKVICIAIRCPCHLVVIARADDRNEAMTCIATSSAVRLKCCATVLSKGARTNEVSSCAGRPRLMARAHRKAIRRRLDRVEVVLLQELQRLLLLILLLLANQGGHAESALRPKAVTGVLQVAILECVLT